LHAGRRLEIFPLISEEGILSVGSDEKRHGEMGMKVVTPYLEEKGSIGRTVVMREKRSGIIMGGPVCTSGKTRENKGQ